MKILILSLLSFGLPNNFQSVEADEFLESLTDSGAYVFQNLGEDLAEAVRAMRKEAPGCVEDDTGALEIEMDDGSQRFTLASNSSQQPFPCAGKSIHTIQKYFDKVDGIIREKMASKFNSLLDIFDAESQKFIVNLEDLPTKSHLHVYEGMPTTAPSPRLMSLPFHTDNGLYLLLTPSLRAPVKIRHRNRTISDLVTKDDSVIFMSGTGLTSWLLPQSANLVATPHAVPSTGSTRITRTVFARMKVAPMQGLSQHSALYFRDHFYQQKAMSMDEEQERHRERMRRQVKRHDSHHWPGETSTGAGCNTYLAWDGPNLEEHTVEEGANGSDQCAEKCRDNRDCAAWTVNKCNGWCALKVDKEEYNEQDNKNFISGRRNSEQNAENCAYAVTVGACN